MQIRNNIGYYTLSDIVKTIIPFLFLPLFTNYLTPYDFGNISFIMIFLSFFSLFFLFGNDTLLKVHYYDFNRAKLKNFILYMVLFSFLLFLFMTIILKIILLYIIIPFDDIYLSYTLIFAFLNSTILTYNIKLQYTFNSKEYFYQQLLLTVMYILLSLVLIIFLNLQWEARILAYFSSILFVVFIIIKYNFKKIKKIKKFNLIIFSNYFSNYFLLSFKSVIFSLNDWTKVNIDKFLIFILLGAESTGLYFFITQFCLAIYFMFFAINKVILPYQIKQYKVNYEKYKRQDIQIILSLIIVSFIGFFIAKYLIEQFVIFFIDYKFLESLKYLNLMLVIYIMHIYMLYLSNKFIILKKQSYLSVFSSVYVLLFLNLSFLLFEKYHLFGVIYANLITSIIILFSYIVFYVKIDSKDISYND